MVNFPDLPPPPQWLKDLVGDTSADGLRGLWAGSHMLAGGTDHFTLVYQAVNQGFSESSPHFLTDQSDFNGVLQLSGTAVSREESIIVKQASVVLGQGLHANHVTAFNYVLFDPEFKIGETTGRPAPFLNVLLNDQRNGDISQTEFRIAVMNAVDCLKFTTLRDAELEGMKQA